MNATKIDLRRNPATTEKARAAAKRSIRLKAIQAYANITPRIVQWRDDGLSYRQIADRLNEAGEKTRMNARFLPRTVLEILERHGASSDAKA